MHRFLIILPIFIWALQVNGQSHASVSNKIEAVNIEIAKERFLESDKGVSYLTEKEIGGSPYLDKQFQECYILKTNGTEIRDMPLRYNIYKNTMEFKKDGKVLEIAVPSEIQRINMGGKVFIYTRYMTPRNVMSGFFQVLYDGNLQLLKKHQVVLNSTSEKTESGNSYVFVSRSPQFYLRFNNGMPRLVYSQKTLIKVLQPIPQGIIDYIKSNRINASDEAQLIVLMGYMEGLQN